MVNTVSNVLMHSANTVHSVKIVQVTTAGVKAVTAVDSVQWSANVKQAVQIVQQSVLNVN